MYEKLKSFLADDSTFYTLLLLVIGVAAFGLGRQSVAEYSQQPAGVVFADTPMVTKEEGNGPEVVASVNGTKYHLLECPGAQQMNEANKVYFDSSLQAEAAGYEPAANCPGL